MNKIVNGVANDFEFDMTNVSYSKAYTEQLLSEKDKEIERLNNIIDETKEKLKFALKCKDNELQCVFEAYEIEEMINKLELKEGK